MASFEERRQTVRIGVNGNLHIESVPPGQALRLVDVGVGGFRVQAVAAMPPDEETSYRFATPDGKWFATFRARTVYCKLMPPGATGDAQYSIGFMFVDGDSKSVQRQLMDLIDHATTFMSLSS